MEQISRFISENPQYVFFGGAGLMVVFSIGSFLGWGWATSPSGSRGRWLYNLLGPTGYRIVTGIMFMFLAGVLGYLGMNNGQW